MLPDPQAMRAFTMRRASLMCAFIPALATLLTVGTARAADPTIAECLAASDASLKLGTDHKLQAERAQLLVCSASSCPSDIRKECLSRVEEVNAAIPSL